MNEASPVDDDQPVRVVIEAPIAEIILNRPDQRNAVNTAVLDGVLAAIEQTEADESVRVVLVRGAGTAFCAGNDLKERAEMTVEQVMARRRHGHHVFAALEGHAKPCIAVVHGPAVAAGCEIALSCDFVFAGASATFRYPEAVRGSGGGTRRLPRIVGKAMAKELLFTGRLVEAAEAERLRMVNRVVADDQLLAVAREVATTIARSRSHAMTLTKRAIDSGLDADPAEAQRIEQEAIQAALTFQSEGAAQPNR
jgi:enoyl-CoA hydratase